MSSASTLASPLQRTEPPPLTKRARFRRLLLDCKDDPYRFNRVVLGRGDYWSRQREICDRAADSKTVVIPTGNAVGKTYTAAGLILWWLYTRYRSLAITTAPSQTLLATVLFKELARAKAGALLPLGGTVTKSPHVSPQQLRLDDEGWQCLGISMRGVERLSGQHAGELLVVVDEASGIEPEIWEAIASLNPSKLVVFGNPLRPDGEFKKLYDLGVADPGTGRDRISVIRVPSTESPDRELARSPRGLADAGFLLDAERKYGKESLWWKTHIDAQFPTATHEALLPAHWVDRCTMIARANGHAGEKIIAADLSAGTGRDKTVILVRDNLGIIDLVCSSFIDVAHAAKEIVRLAREHGVRDDHVYYDAGGDGRDLPRYLEQFRFRACVPYVGSTTGGSRFSNRRSRSAWHLRQRLDPGRPLELEQTEEDHLYLPTRTPHVPSTQIQPPFAIPAGHWWTQMREELTSLKYRLEGSRIALEQKDVLAARLGRSPDFADALIMSFAGGGDE